MTPDGTSIYIDTLLTGPYCESDYPIEAVRHAKKFWATLKPQLPAGAPIPDCAPGPCGFMFCWQTVESGTMDRIGPLLNYVEVEIFPDGAMEYFRCRRVTDLDPEPELYGFDSEDADTIIRQVLVDIGVTDGVSK